MKELDSYKVGIEMNILNFRVKFPIFSDSYFGIYRITLCLSPPFV